MQTQGSLQESSLASLLQTMQTERATGALSIENAADNASLYFLFGHLFHAAGPGGQGEDVVINALGWHQGNFRFDPRAKLPPEETIKASPTDLISEAERRTPGSSTGPAAEPEAVGGWAAGAGFGVPIEAASEPAPAQFETPVYPQPVEDYPVASWGTPHQPDYAPQYTPEPAAVPEAAPAGDTSSVASWGQSAPEQQRYEAPAYQAPAAPAYETPSANSYQPEAPAATAYLPPSYEPAPVPGLMAADSAPRPGGGVLGAPGAPPLDILYPLPSGKSQYEGLKSAFVDFPKLLRTLRGDQHTGYVRLTGPDFSGVLLFHEGHLLQALSSDHEAAAGDSAFMAIRRQMDAGTGTIDVIDLSGDTVDSMAQLLTAPLMYTGLLGRFVNFDALLEHLSEEKVEGAIVVVGDDDIGIILLSQGEVLGAYTQQGPKLETATAGVAAIAAEKGARIEVKSGTGSVAGIDVESALNRPY